MKQPLHTPMALECERTSNEIQSNQIKKKSTWPPVAKTAIGIG
eukprot:CAMPEP_0179968332 /NCGR_PEP_ID=MMETSP0983-20121128/33795_1 /TAXON_ID=483367 /ORGANISM="non described non described, Strain CCMP 2436" /LENGTH=42 /DNA_ID= /DNA_START= /DNA_END= /DNA_ORIENTATION=